MNLHERTLNVLAFKVSKLNNSCRGSNMSAHVLSNLLNELWK